MVNNFNSGYQPSRSAALSRYDGRQPACSVAKYARLNAEKQLHFIPVVITTFGALGPQATQFVDEAADFYSAKSAIDRGLCQQLLERLQVALLQEVGKRLLAGIQATAEEEWMSLTT